MPVARRSILLAPLSLAGVSTPQESPPAAQQTGWFYRATWGAFVHYLGSPGLSAEDWNRRIDRFDVEGLANQLQAVRAGYLFITLGQNSGHYLAPNRRYDQFVGIHPSKCSRRDLVEDLYRALSPKGIGLMVYLPSGAPDQDHVAMQRLEWAKGPHRNLNFQRKWEQVIAEWSERWGGKIAGWWFDGCYWPNAMYRHAGTPNFASFAAAARKGNSQSIVAFNRGVVYPVIPQSEHEDYTAGEVNEPQRARCDGRFVDLVQWHMLSYLGQSWSQGPPRFATGEAVEHTRRLVAKGGVVSWDIPTDTAGMIPPPFLEQLKAIGEAAAAVGR
jgi:hypothetical protein